jgi:hypothetical protein
MWPESPVSGGSLKHARVKRIFRRQDSRSSRAAMGDRTDASRCGSRCDALATPAAWRCLAAMRRASSRVSQMRRRASSRLLLEIDVGERMPVVVADNEAVLAQLHVRVID